MRNGFLLDGYRGYISLLNWDYRYWIDKHGETICVDDISPEYAHNILLYLKERLASYDLKFIKYTRLYLALENKAQNKGDNKTKDKVTKTITLPELTKEESNKIDSYKNYSKSEYFDGLGLYDLVGECDNENTRKMAIAYLFGYTVKKDTKYYIKVLNTESGYLNHCSIDGTYSIDTSSGSNLIQTAFTDSEINELKTDKELQAINWDKVTLEEAK